MWVYWRVALVVWLSHGILPGINIQCAEDRLRRACSTMAVGLCLPCAKHVMLLLLGSSFSILITAGCRTVGGICIGGAACIFYPRVPLPENPARFESLSGARAIDVQKWTLDKLTHAVMVFYQLYDFLGTYKIL